MLKSNDSRGVKAAVILNGGTIGLCETIINAWNWVLVVDDFYAVGDEICA